LIILIFHSATETRIWIANVLQNEAGIFHVTHSCLSTTKHTDSTLFYLKCCANYLSKAVPIRWCYGIWVEIYQHTLICFANPCHSHLHSTTSAPLLPAPVLVRISVVSFLDLLASLVDRSKILPIRFRSFSGKRNTTLEIKEPQSETFIPPAWNYYHLKVEKEIHSPTQDIVANAESIVSYSFQSWDISYQQPCTIDWEASKSKEIFIQHQR
jgi:hypothetical protein